MTAMNDKFNNLVATTGVAGHVMIRDYSTGDILVDAVNSIHYEHMSLVLARSLANRPDGNIHEMHFGNGGSIVNGTGAITYFPPNVLGPNADLYNPTYFKIVNDQSPMNLAPAKNYIEVRHIVNTVYSDVIITCTLDYSEPAGQEAFDDATDLEGNFIFDEIGLKCFDPTPGNGLLLSHVIFSPVQKSLNRVIEIQYTIRIAMC
jgi:hypothetical protein